MIVLRSSDIQPLMHEMKSMELSESTPKKPSAPMAAYQKFGSKLGAIVQLLKEIKEKDSQVPVMGQRQHVLVAAKEHQLRLGFKEKPGGVVVDS